MPEEHEKPDYCTDEHLRFLDQLREGGSVNMFGASQPLREVYFELDKQQARAIVAYWMKTFSERHPD
jgi:hypothetical protein